MECSNGFGGCWLLDVELGRDVVIVHVADADVRDVASRSRGRVDGQADGVAKNAAARHGEATGVGIEHLRGRIPVVAALTARHREAQEYDWLLVGQYGR